ncbi:phosphate ABC transporter permease subunit PstC [uncultured Brachyspira sp.]|uniref:phosphate ABC transporter permease subunit PstC n=1 Tax=uncultured Brachyspira sp. TaxID=221953 RepID=UPI00261F6A7A|nr:phosphate ABC transporter permease subunit PstC [uncultured Brachyspira sp.]
MLEYFNTIKNNNAYLKEAIFSLFVTIVSFLCIIVLAFIIFFIVKESIPILKHIGIYNFVFGKVWRPLAFGVSESYGIFYIILATIYTAMLSTLISLFIGIGFSIFLVFIANDFVRSFSLSLMDLIVAVPSVIYGFIGLVIIVKFFEHVLNMSAGESVLAASILLSFMILPFIISTVTESMMTLKKSYNNVSISLGVDKWYMVLKLILPNSKNAILVGFILAVSRALGETMAVMMVIGNSLVFPRLLGKAETIASLIALEIGMAEVKSMHYSALFASGAVLMITLSIINISVHFLKKYLLKLEL